MRNKWVTIGDFKTMLRDGMHVMVGGFMAVGTPEPLIDAMVESGVSDLTIICNDAGYPESGVGKLIANRQVKRLIASHIGLNPVAGKQMSEGVLEVCLTPQGTLIEQIRAGGAGLGGVLTKTGLGTMVEEGKQIVTIDGINYLLEKPLRADLAIIRGSEVDDYGNVVYHATTRNFNPYMAMATDHVVVWTPKRVESLNPDHIMTPHIFVDAIVKGDETDGC